MMRFVPSEDPVSVKIRTYDACRVTRVAMEMRIRPVHIPIRSP